MTDLGHAQRRDRLHHLHVLVAEIADEQHVIRPVPLDVRSIVVAPGTVDVADDEQGSFAAGADMGAAE
jgi:hypothetical protein